MLMTVLGRFMGFWRGSMDFRIDGDDGFIFDDDILF